MDDELNGLYYLLGEGYVGTTEKYSNASTLLPKHEKWKQNSIPAPRPYEQKKHLANNADQHNSKTLHPLKPSSFPLAACLSFLSLFNCILTYQPYPCDVIMVVFSLFFPSSLLTLREVPISAGRLPQLNYLHLMN
jgi:hypothetical protein